jgi:membrane protein implicated in regulation of membrane protease activity
MSHAMVVWAIAALLLVAAEAMAPGLFLLWIGLAAGAMFFLVWALPGLSPLAQAVAFAVFSGISIGVWIRVFRGRRVATDQPRLNKRGEQLIGQVLPLHEAIVNGKGRVKWGDALWTVEGPELAAGSMVRVVGAHSMSLTVVPS